MPILDNENRKPQDPIEENEKEKETTQTKTEEVDAAKQQPEVIPDEASDKTSEENSKEIPEENTEDTNQNTENSQEEDKPNKESEKFPMPEPAKENQEKNPEKKNPEKPTPSKSKEPIPTWKKILLAPVYLARFLFRQVVSLLDRISGFNRLSLNAKSPQQRATEEGQKQAKTPEEVREEAKEHGAKDKELSAEALNFQNFAKETLGEMNKNIQDIQVKPIKYNERDRYLDISIQMKNGTQFKYTIDENLNGLKLPDTYVDGLGRDVAATYAKFCSLNKYNIFEKNDVIQSVQKDIIDFMRDNGNHAFARGIIMVNSVPVRISFSQIQDVAEIKFTPLIQGQNEKAEPLGKYTSYQGDKSATFTVKEIGDLRFNDFFSQIAKAGNEYYINAFNNKEEKNRHILSANFLEKKLKEISPDYSVKSVQIDKNNNFVINVSDGYKTDKVVASLPYSVHGSHSDNTVNHYMEISMLSYMLKMAPEEIGYSKESFDNLIMPKITPKGIVASPTSIGPIKLNSHMLEDGTYRLELSNYSFENKCFNTVQTFLFSNENQEEVRDKVNEMIKKTIKDYEKNNESIVSAMREEYSKQYKEEQQNMDDFLDEIDKPHSRENDVPQFETERNNYHDSEIR